MKSLTKQRIKRAQVVAFLLQIVPFIRLVGLNGSLTQGEARKESDIDFLIIAEKNRIYTVRFFATILVHLTGTRRRGKKKAGRICLNRYQTSNALGIFPHNKYHAKVFSRLWPLFDDGKIYREYKKENRWMRRFEKSFFSGKIRPVKSQWFSKIRIFFENRLSGPFGEKLENYLRDYQIQRIKKDQRTFLAPAQRIRVSDKELCLHPGE